MYLSRVEIDRADRRKMRDLTHLGAFHNWVESSYPEEVHQKIRSRKLWRIDQLRGKSYLLVLSESMPDLKAMERYGVPDSGECRDYDSLLDALEEGQRLRFRLVANPVHSIVEAQGKRGVEKPHVTAEHQMRYFLQRAESNGFQVSEEEVRIVERGFVTLRKQGNKAVKVVKAAYEGMLTVTDLNLFKHALTNGIGKKKAYGFGLMTVIPVATSNE